MEARTIVWMWSYMCKKVTHPYRTGVILMNHLERPNRPKRVCGYPGCFASTYQTYCASCQIKVDKRKAEREQKYREQVKAEVEQGIRYTYTHLYNTSTWRSLRVLFLKEHPLCVICREAKRLTPATEVDHIKPHKGDLNLFFEPSNLQPLCKPCHSRKTAREDGGFGNQSRDAGQGGG